MTSPVDAEIEIPSFLQGFALIHQAMRRDLQALPGAIRRLDGAPAGRAAALAAWYQRFHGELVHHHEREDEIVWPDLVARAPDFAVERAVLEQDHHALDDALDDVGRRVRGLTGGDSPAAAVAAAEHLGDLLRDHLEREEAAAFRRIVEHYTAEEFLAMEKAMSDGLGLRDFAFVLPWVLDGLAPDEAAALLTDLPAPIRLLNRLGFAPRYRKLAAPLR